jgi:hypothetical protein
LLPPPHNPNSAHLSASTLPSQIDVQLAGISININCINSKLPTDMSDEKAPLISRFDATQAMPGAAPRHHRCAAKKTVLKVLGATAAAGILYYSIPEGNGIDTHADGTRLTVLQSRITPS